MDFESQEFYRDNFSVMHYWAAAAVVGGLFPRTAFFLAVFWCGSDVAICGRPMKGTADVKHVGVEADTRWLQ